MYSSVMDTREPFGYAPSDLKDVYLSREALQSRMVAPEITQEQILAFQRQQSNGAAQAQAPAQAQRQ